MRTKYYASVIALLVLLLAMGRLGTAQSSPGPEGQWTFALGSRTLLILSIIPTPGETNPFSGTFSRPRQFQTRDAWSFSHIYGEVVNEPIANSAWKDGTLSITVQNPLDPSDKDVFLFTLKDATHAQLQYESIPLPPISFIRAQGMHAVATDWDKDKTYSPDDDLPSDPQMKRIFEEDQRDRQAGLKIGWASVSKSDTERRQAVSKLLTEGSLHTGEDFTRAAFVFQHGSLPDDYLLAHTLAMVALKKGYGDALWIATAALDRYLQSMHQPQIYGTQFLTPQGQPTTQEPYNRTLISDQLRRQLSVPMQSAQEEQTRQYDAQRGIAK